MGSNPAHGNVYSIQHLVFKFVIDLRQVGGFLRILLASFTNKTNRHDITEILLKVALNTITLTQYAYLPSKTSNSKYVDFLKFAIFAVQLQFPLWYEGRTLMDNVDITIDEFVKSDTGWLTKQSQINSNVSYFVQSVYTRHVSLTVDEASSGDSLSAYIYGPSISVNK